MVLVGEDEQANPNTQQSAKPPKPKRIVPPRAEVWTHFKRLADDMDRSACVHCGFEVGCCSKTVGTSPMRGHIKRCKMLVGSGSEGQGQTVLNGDASGVSNNKVEPVLFRKAVNEMVVLNELPFSFVESEGFKRFCGLVLPAYKTFSRRTATRDIAAMYLSEKASLKKVFSVAKKRVSLTTDIWVAPTTSYNYMVVTAHWIDDNWMLQKKIISLKPITDHRGETIARHLSECLEDWGIEKVFTITVDNARNNDKALRVFSDEFGIRAPDALVLEGAYLHMRCCAHILNLVVRDGLVKVNDSIVAIRNSVKYVRSSFARLRAFEMRCESGKVARGSLALDCATRWNSTYLMLTSALKLRVAFERMVAEDKLYCDYFLEEEDKGKKRVGPPSTEDWDQVQVLVKFLKIFFNCTLAFSASKTVTSTLCYNEIVTIERNLISRTYNGTREIRNQALIMREKFDKYWDGLVNMNPLVIIASVFDPRNKLQFATLCFEKLYGKDSVEYKQLYLVVTNAMKKLFGEYNLRLGGAIRLDSTPHKSEPLQVPDLSDDDDDEYERMDSVYSQMLKENRPEDSVTELDMYLLEKTELRLPNTLGLDYDVLSWWRSNRAKYPILSEVAKDILAIQVSSVVSESVFSTSGRILDLYRSSLTPYMIEALICTQQWLRIPSQSSIPDQIPTLMQMLDEVDFYESMDPRKQDETQGQH